MMAPPVDPPQHLGTGRGRRLAASAEPALRNRRVVEHEASSLFDEGSPDLAFCEIEAQFAHRDACEYLIYLPDLRADRRTQLRSMQEAGVSADFLAVVRAAHRRKAEYLLLWCD
jgi:hypothetical protein